LLLDLDYQDEFSTNIMGLVSVCVSLHW